MISPQAAAAASPWWRNLRGVGVGKFGVGAPPPKIRKTRIMNALNGFNHAGNLEMRGKALAAADYAI
jgi:hypothetical protein